MFVGIGELRNEKMKEKDELISLSSAISKEPTVVQFLSPKLIAGPTHLLSAAQNAMNAVRGKYVISRSLNVELLVYASAQRQIERAFEKVGVEDGLETVGVLIISESKDSIQECFEELFKKLGRDVEPAFHIDRKRMDQIMTAFEVSDTEEDKKVFEVREFEYLTSQFHTFDSCLMALKKINEYMPSSE